MSPWKGPTVLAYRRREHYKPVPHFQPKQAVASKLHANLGILEWQQKPVGILSQELPYASQHTAARSQAGKDPKDIVCLRSCPLLRAARNCFNAFDTCSQEPLWKVSVSEGLDRARLFILKCSQKVVLCLSEVMRMLRENRLHAFFILICQYASKSLFSHVTEHESCHQEVT